MSAASDSEKASENQYLSFILAGEEYGINILSVQELRGWEKTTRIPNTPDFVKGVINLRGVVIPIVDLRLRFNLAVMAYDSETVVVIVKVILANKSRVLGLVVDAVAEVYHIHASEIQPPPEMNGAIAIDFIQGLVPRDDNMLILLDINRLINEGVLSNSFNSSKPSNSSFQSNKSKQQNMQQECVL